jgi:hypothetical protein
MRSLLLSLLVVVACSRASRDHEPAPAPVHPATTASPLTGAPAAMTHTDPKDPAAWAEAEKIAAAQNAGKVSKRSDALPFLFQADRAHAVLVHKGQVITQRGPVVAGAYLRDLGVAQGKGPQLDDVLWTLWALDALPDVKPLAAEGYVHVANNPRLADITANIEWDGQSAHIVLHYFKPEPALPKDVRVSGSGPSGTAVGGSAGNGKIRALVRMTLDVPEKGDAAWRREDLNWLDPG